jgi:hypothetical protein
LFAGWIVIVHVLAVFWLVGGILGRGITHHRAARTTDLAQLRFCVELGSTFERQVRMATGFVFLAGLGAAWARGWPILGFLQGRGPNWVLAAIVIYLTIIPWIVFVFVPRGRMFRAALDEAVSRGELTNRVTAALRDPVVQAARAYELLMVAVLTWLMVMRPF